MKISELDPTQIRRLAALAKCSPGSLRHVSQGRRGVSSEMAIRLERAARRMGLDLRRETMNTGCATCEFARNCRKVTKNVG